MEKQFHWLKVLSLIFKGKLILKLKAQGLLCAFFLLMRLQLFFKVRIPQLDSLYNY